MMSRELKEPVKPRKNPGDKNLPLKNEATKTFKIPTTTDSFGPKRQSVISRIKFENPHLNPPTGIGGGIIYSKTLIIMASAVRMERNVIFEELFLINVSIKITC
jgi:hypothetical protein